MMCLRVDFRSIAMLRTPRLLKYPGQAVFEESDFCTVFRFRKEQVPIRPRGPAPAWGGVVSSRDSRLVGLIGTHHTVEPVYGPRKMPQFSPPPVADRILRKVFTLFTASAG